MLNGPVMGGFSRLLNESGLEFGEKELETLNEELAKRDNPPFIFSSKNCIITRRFFLEMGNLGIIFILFLI